MNYPLMHQLSWSKVNLFLQCPRCFYKEQVLKKKRPGADPDFFSLNNAVDSLLKNEFDEYRKQKKAHPIMTQYNIEAIPFMHELLPNWRSYKTGGIRFCDYINNVELFGVIDDIWINLQHELIIVDYKATARQGSVVLNLNYNWNITNKRQASFYAYLFKKHGYQINNTGYFIYSIANTDKSTFNEKLEFEMRVLPYQIDYSWIEKAIQDIRNCLDQEFVPAPKYDCNYCNFNSRD